MSGPTLIAAVMERAARLYGAGDLEGALALCDDILRADPAHFYALHLIATIAVRQGRHEDCVRFATRALQSNPRNAEALSNRGAALRALRRYEEALADYDRSLALAPRSAATLNNRGVTLAALGRHREAVESYDQALRLDSEYARARYNRSLSRLMLGDFRNGWIDYESRWPGGETPSAPRPFTAPPFTESDWGRGHRVALWAEQGLGDQILFATLATELEARGEAFVLEVDRRLLPAFVRARPRWQVCAREDSAAAFASCDRNLPQGSLGRLFRNARESFERQPQALLAPDPRRAAAYRALVALPGARAIGLSWRTFQPRLRAYYELAKSAPLAGFLPLGAAESVRLVDLQYGDTQAERDAFADEGGRLVRIPDLDLYNDLDGLLAAIDACEVVVTTSNVTAHLAGSIGKRTLLCYLDANPPFHYWAPNAAGRSPWYPSVEIVSGGALDTWARITGRVREILGV